MGVTVKQFYGSAEVAVASDLKSAVEFAIAEGFSKLFVEGDANGILDCIEVSQKSLIWEVVQTVDDVCELVESKLDVKFCFTWYPRFRNKKLLIAWLN